MKNLAIAVNSAILYLILAGIVIFGFVMMGVSENVWTAFAFWIVGIVSWCVLSGFWFVQVAQLEELKKLNRKGK